MRKKFLCILSILCLIGVLSGCSKEGKHPEKEVLCYTVDYEAEQPLPVIQEDRQYLIESYDKFVKLCENYGIKSQVIKRNDFKHYNLLVMLSNESSDDVNCNLKSLYIDKNNEPHMIVDKVNEDAKGNDFVFIAKVEKGLMNKLNLSRWNKY